jgi:hypothetical protein
MSQVYYVSTTKIVERRRRIRKASQCYSILERSGKYWVGHGLLFTMFLGTFNKNKQDNPVESVPLFQPKERKGKKYNDST